MKSASVVFLAAALCLAPSAFAADTSAAAPKVQTQQLDKKMDQIIATQKEIIQKLDEIKSEVEVVKIRATR